MGAKIYIFEFLKNMSQTDPEHTTSINNYIQQP